MSEPVLTSVDVYGCSACGGDHPGLELQPYERPVVADGSAVGVVTHWAPCPTTGEPLLMGEVQPSASYGEAHRGFGSNVKPRRAR